MTCTSPPLLLLCLLTLVSTAKSLVIDVNDEASIKHASFVFSHGLMTYYNGNQSGEVPGMFVSPYYWWEAGAAWDTLIGYWFLTGDTTYNEIVKSSLLYQVGSDNNYMPTNQSTTEGNDDQGFWGFAVMTAAERNFSNPSSDEPQWLELAQKTFNSMAARWDTSSCGGGLRWQIFQLNNGYTYKNTISNAALFLLAARLARYTGLQKYVEWGEKVWDWIEDVKYLDTDTYYFYDGADVATECEDLDYLQWSYNAAIFLAGAAYLYNYTEDATWLNRTLSTLSSISIFFYPSTGIMYEAACETVGKCDTDQLSFKAYLARYMGVTAQLVPETYSTVMDHFTTTIRGIEQSCVGGTDNVTCGTIWFNESGWDNTWGLGQQMSALEVTQNLLIGSKDSPYTADSGGSSSGLPNGTDGNDNNGSSSSDSSSSSKVVSRGEQAGAGVLTAGISISMILLFWWLIV
ncbi:glycosyl hydrolase family 76-domain-containing protein [Lipomyces oligophaga]|uniref:glycosyl hydrolase family 76-domain-containing protein n=1 Tax=Lipomyces oligophaga TaxID=45792 RepID=UPI0034CE4614